MEGVKSAGRALSTSVSALSPPADEARATISKVEARDEDGSATGPLTNSERSFVDSVKRECKGSTGGGGSAGLYLLASPVNLPTRVPGRRRERGASHRRLNGEYAP